jgi:hypothetical protein
VEVVALLPKCTVLLIQANYILPPVAGAGLENKVVQLGLIVQLGSREFDGRAASANVFVNELWDTSKRIQVTVGVAGWTNHLNNLSFCEIVRRIVPVRLEEPIACVWWWQRNPPSDCSKPEQLIGYKDRGVNLVTTTQTRFDQAKRGGDRSGDASVQTHHFVAAKTQTRHKS